MSRRYRAVNWTPRKRAGDAWLLLGIVSYLVLFLWAHTRFFPDTSPRIVWIRAFGSGAFFLLHVILSIGPLCRLDARFLPLLAHRRHFGVAMFAMAATHALLVVLEYHAFGDVLPLTSIFEGSGSFGALADVPFQPLGLFALVILFLLAATSHDFWLRLFTPAIWKTLHMSVYLAYLLLVGHVVLGAVQVNASPVPGLLVALGMFAVLLLHLLTAFTGRIGEPVHGIEMVDVCGVDEIPNRRAKIVKLSGERLAVFREEDRIIAVTNVCPHQHGPLGEGEIVGECIRCPWHGARFRTTDGHSLTGDLPPVVTFPVTVRGNRVFVHPIPNPLGETASSAHIEVRPA